MSELPEGFVLEDPGGGTEAPTDLPEGFVLEEKTGEGRHFIGEFGTGVNIGLSEVLGAPVDLGNWVLSAAGLDSDTPFLGSKHIREMFEDMGVMGQEKDTMLQNIGKEVGRNVAGFGFTGALARSSLKTGVFEPMMDVIRQSPMKAALAEMGISLPMGAGGHIGKEWGEEIGMGEAGELTGQLVGALSPGGVAALSMPFKGIKTAAQAANETIGFTTKAKRTAAGKFIRENMTREADLAAYKPDDYPEFGVPTTGELLDDPGLMALHRQRQLLDVGASNELQLAKRQSVKSGLSEFAGGDPAKARAAFQKKVDDAVNKISQRADQQAEILQKRIDALGDDALPSEIQVITRNTFDGLYDNARAHEKTLWKQSGVKEFDIDPVKTRAQEIINDLRKADVSPHPIFYELAEKDALVRYPSELLDEFGNTIMFSKVEPGKFSKVESLDTVDSLKSRIGELYRMERRAGREQRAGQLAQLLEALHERVIPMTRGAQDAMAKSNEARGFSRKLHATFTKGPLGALRGFAKAGDMKIAPEATLTKMLTGREQSVKAVDALRSAARDFGGDVKQMDDNIRKYIIARVKLDGPAFLKTNAEMMRTFYPDLLGSLNDAQIAQKLLNGLNDNYTSLIHRVKTQTALGKAIGGEASSVVDGILSSKNPTRELRKMKRVAEAAGPDAVDGLKAAFYERMMQEVSVDEAGEVVIRAGKLAKFVRQRSSLVKELYGESGLKLMNSISRGATISSRTGVKGRAPFVGSDTAENLKGLIGNLGVIMGAKLASGTHTLLAAGIGRKWATKIAGSIIDGTNDTVMTIIDRALVDPEFAQLLLKEVPKPQMKHLSSTELKLLDYAIIQSLISETISSEN